MVRQKKMIESFAQQGDCVIVGRCADIILKEYHPFNIFVYADKDTKLKRCLARAADDEHLTEREILSKMRDIDKSRAKNRSYYTDAKWGEKQDYHLCINTSGKEIKSLIPAIAQYIKCWYA